MLTLFFSVELWVTQRCWKLGSGNLVPDNRVCLAFCPAPQSNLLVSVLFYYCACAEEIGLFLTLRDITGDLRLPENQPQYCDLCHLVFSRKWKRCGSHRISWTVNVLAGVFPAPWKASKAAWKMLLAKTARASSPWWEQFSNTCTGLCSRCLFPP